MKFPFKKKLETPDTMVVPEHVAIIMDGNGRWAKKRGLPRVAGHRAGADSVKKIVESCDALGIKYLTLYAFSSENWSRPEKEVTALMELLEKFLKDRLPEMLADNVRLRAIGRLDMLSDSVREALDYAIAKTAENAGDETAVTLTLALSYGGREEILDAAKGLAKDVAGGKVDIEEVTNDTFSQYLYTSDMPDPDLLIRTSGELRLSNFLLWQLSYAEIVITETLWPDFRHAELVDALVEFSARDRRFGKVK